MVSAETAQNAILTCNTENIQHSSHSTHHCHSTAASSGQVPWGWHPYQETANHLLVLLGHQASHC